MDRINKLKAFIAEQPADSFLKHALALEYIKTGEDALARSLFEELLLHDAGYVGSYYHLAKLLERQQEMALAVAIYKQGVAMAKTAGDNHARTELQMALDELVD